MSHSGFGTYVPQLDPAPPHGRRGWQVFTFTLHNTPDLILGRCCLVIDAGRDCSGLPLANAEARDNVILKHEMCVSSPCYEFVLVSRFEIETLEISVQVHPSVEILCYLNVISESIENPMGRRPRSHPMQELCSRLPAQSWEPRSVGESQYAPPVVKPKRHEMKPASLDEEGFAANINRSLITLVVPSNQKAADCAPPLEGNGGPEEVF